MVLGPEIVREVWRAVGYRLGLLRVEAYSGEPARADAVLNNRAKRDRLPQGDMTEVLTFVPA